MKQTFLVTIDTMSKVTAEELEHIIYEELGLMYYHPDVDVVEIGKVDSESEQ